MALLDDLAGGGNVVSSLAIVTTALIIWPLVNPLVSPLARTAIRGGILAYHEATKLYEATAGGIGDLIKEAAQELGPGIGGGAAEEVGAEVAEEAI